MKRLRKTTAMVHVPRKVVKLRELVHEGQTQIREGMEGAADPCVAAEHDH